MRGHASLFIPFLLGCAAALAAQTPRGSAPTLILLGGKVFTADSARPWAQAIAIRGERILALGTDAEIARLAGPTTRRIALDGYRSHRSVTNRNGTNPSVSCTWPVPQPLGTPFASAAPFCDPTSLTAKEKSHACARA